MHNCLPGGLPAPATPTHTTMPCALKDAIDAANENPLHTERLEVSGRTSRPRTGMRSAGELKAGADGQWGTRHRKLGSFLCECAMS